MRTTPCILSLVAALATAMSASAATELTVSSDTSISSDLLDRLLSDGLTISDTIKSSVMASGNADYYVTSDQSSLTISESLYFYSFTNTNTTSLSLSFTKSGYIWTSQQFNFAQNLETLTITVDLTGLTYSDTTDGVYSQTLIYAAGNYGIWNFSEVAALDTFSLSISGLEGTYTSAGLVSSVDELSDGQYGLVYSDSQSADSLTFYIKLTSSVPEPATASLSLLGLGALLLRRRRH